MSGYLPATGFIRRVVCGCSSGRDRISGPLARRQVSRCIAQMGRALSAISTPASLPIRSACCAPLSPAGRVRRACGCGWRSRTKAPSKVWPKTTSLCSIPPGCSSPRRIPAPTRNVSSCRAPAFRSSASSPSSAPALLAASKRKPPASDRRQTDLFPVATPKSSSTLTAHAGRRSPAAARCEGISTWPFLNERPHELPLAALYRQGNTLVCGI